MPSRTDTKSGVVARAQSLSAGVEKHLANVGTLTFLGRSYTPGQLTTELARVVSLRTDVDAAKAAAKAKLVVEEADMPALRALMGALGSYVKATYGNQPDVLADFGIFPKARAVPTAAATTAAVAKRAATRAARHTLGPVAKKGIKGAVTGVTVTPVVAGAPSVTPAAPVSPSGGAPSSAATAPAPRTTP
jgi:hypothetical protein